MNFIAGIYNNFRKAILGLIIIHTLRIVVKNITKKHSAP